MLSSIKEKLLNVKKNVHLFTNDSKTFQNNKSLNNNAGADILSHFQKQWVTIHEINENNAKEAEALAVNIETISKRIKNDSANLSLITHILTNSNLKTNITNCLTSIKEMHSTCERVESELIDLEILIDEVEFEGMKQQHRYHLEQYEIRKKETIEQLKCSLEEKYKASIVNNELNKKKVLEERQKVFQEAFKSDLEQYKHLGTIPKMDLPKKQTSSALLEEIQLDYDQNELDQFFGDN